MNSLAIVAKFVLMFTEIGCRYEINRKTYRIAVDRVGRAQRVFRGSVDSVRRLGQRSRFVIGRGSGIGTGCSEIQVL